MYLLRKALGRIVEVDDEQEKQLLENKGFYEVAPSDAEAYLKERADRYKEATTAVPDGSWKP